jgi:hypothetical protein
MLFGHLLVGHQVMGLLLVERPHLVRSGRQAPDVTELLLSQLGPQGARKLNGHRSVGQQLRRLTVTQRLGLEKDV